MTDERHEDDAELSEPAAPGASEGATRMFSSKMDGWLAELNPSDFDLGPAPQPLDISLPMEQLVAPPAVPLPPPPAPALPQPFVVRQPERSSAAPWLFLILLIVLGAAAGAYRFLVPH